MSKTPAEPVDDDDDDDLLGQVGALGSMINAARDEDLDPELRGLAQHAANTAAANLQNRPR